MADRRRLVTLSAAGVPTVVSDLERPNGGLTAITNVVSNPSFETGVHDYVCDNGGTLVNEIYDPRVINGGTHWVEFANSTVNLVTNPRLASATSPWTASATSGITGLAGTRETCDWHPGATHCFQVTGTQPADTTERRISAIPGPTGASAIAVSPSTSYSLSTFVKTVNPSDGTNAYRLVIEWYLSDGVTPSATPTSTSSYTADENLVDSRLTFTATSPSDAARAILRVDLLTNVASDVLTFQTTAAQFEAAAAPTAYFDGSGRIDAANRVINPRAEVNTTGCITTADAGITANTLTRVACDWHTGSSWCFNVTGTQPADTTDRNVYLHGATGVGTSGLPIAGSLTYSWSVYVKTIDPSTDQGYQLSIWWYDAAGAFISSSSGAAVSDEGVVDTRLTLTAAAPSNATYAVPSVRMKTATANDVVTFQATALQFEQAAAPTTYFDGDTTDDSLYSYEWEGTAHASRSVQRNRAFKWDGTAHVSTSRCHLLIDTTTDAGMTLGPTVGRATFTTNASGFDSVVNTQPSTGGVISDLTGVTHVAVRMRAKIHQLVTTVGNSLNLKIRCFTSADAYLGSLTVQTQNTPATGTWYSLSGVMAVSTILTSYPTTAKVGVELVTDTTAAGSCIFMFEGAALYKCSSAVVPDYFDGSMEGFGWTGVTNASSSIDTFTLTQVADTSVSGLYVGQFAGGAANDWDLYLTQATKIACDPGQQIAVSGYVNIVDATSVENLRLGVAFWDSGGSVLVSDLVAAQTVAAPVFGQWYRLSGVVTAPALAEFASLRVRIETVTAGTPFTVQYDALGMWMSETTVPEYFDGDSAGSLWNGVVGSSTSTRLPNTVVCVRDTFEVVPPAASPVMARRERRYGGSVAVSETHDNGSIAMTLYVRGDTETECFSNLSEVLAATQAARSDLFFEWRPDGTDRSVFYEVAGPAVWSPHYSWIMFQSQKMLSVDVRIPVLPLARLTPVSFATAATALPTVTTNITGVGGDAPALVDVSLATTVSAKSAVIGWWKRPTGTPLVGHVAPVGVIQAEDCTAISGWSVVADATYEGGDGIRVTTSGAGSAAATFLVDPSLLEPDDFSDRVSLEVWCKYEMASGVVSPRLALATIPNSSVATYTYSHEHGSTGRSMVVPSSGTVKRFSKLGTVSLPVNRAAPPSMKIAILGSWAAGSSGVFGVDYLFVVPSRSRASSKTGVAGDSAYPVFLPNTAAQIKTIKSDLSGTYGDSGENAAPHSGLGGSQIEVQPGDTNMLVLLAAHPPDDPTASTNTEPGTSATTSTVTATVWPRVHLA